VIGVPIVLALGLAACPRDGNPTTPTTPTPTTPTPTTPTTAPPTTVPDPLHSVFAQAGEGVEFDFKDQGGRGRLDWRYDRACHRAGQPYGVRLTWSMRGDGFGGWGVLWTKSKVKRFDASRFTQLTFWVKGQRGSERFQVGLKDTRRKETKIESTVLAPVSRTNWQPLTIALSRFSGVDLKRVDNLNFGFNRNHGSGEVCIDQIELR